MKLFNGKINVLHIEKVSDGWKIQINFFDGYMDFTMNNISVGDYVFLNCKNGIGEEIGLFTVSDTSELDNDTITISAEHDLVPLFGDGIICRNEGTSFLPTTLDGLSQQLIDRARNIDLNLFAKNIYDLIDNIDIPSKEVFWHYEEGLSYLANGDVSVSNKENKYFINVSEGTTLKSISFELSELGEAENIEDDIFAYTIDVDFDVNQVFTPNRDFSFVNNKLEVMGTIPSVELVSMTDQEFKICDIVYPELLDYHTLRFKFVSSVKTDDNTLVVKLVF